jgi:uncharacterized DUF497 family protein
MPTRFEWDPTKAASNFLKHGVSFNEAMTVFDDPDRLLLPDPWHSTPQEKRELVIGTSDLERELLVVYTERDPDRTRIISARPADRRERKRYHENQAKNRKARPE